ncbi:MAG TPA: hypothetical protein VF911_11255, partial [Thermoanaerobaculia bacterium]
LSMTVACDGGSCTATTTNTGGSCSGLVYTGWFSQETSEHVRFTDVDTTLPGIDECYDADEWGELEAAFAFCYGHSDVGSGFTSRVTVSGANASNVPLVAITWVGSADGEDELGSAYAFTNATAPTCTPIVSAPPVTQSGVEYAVTWTAISDPTAQYIIEESTSPDFSTNTTQAQVHGLSRAFRHDGMATTTTYYYRVRPTHCSGGTPQPSQVTQTVVQAVAAPTSERAEITVPIGTITPVPLQVFIPGATTAAVATFTAVTDKPYLTVHPSSGELPPSGRTVTILADPASLPPGANTGTLIVTISTATGGLTANGTSTIQIPVSISLVTPVAAGGKTTPPANAMMIPVVTHVNAAVGPFLSDVRLTNAGGAPVKYQITLTPTQTNALVSSKITQITVDGNQTIALNDIVKNFFGYGATPNPADVGFGSLEIRPLNTSSTATYASSRTYASTANGTFGQFVAAMPFTKFATKRVSGVPIPGAPQTPGSPVISLQQVAQSVKFRTNLGIVEGAGEAATGRIRIFNALGTMLKEVPYSLQPGEHKQMNRFISDPNLGGIANLEDGRIEITVDSPTGAVTAYASVLDNVTTDPLAVMPVDVSKVSATRYIVPGMAELPNRVNNFHSDLRVFNGGTTDVPLTLTFYPLGGGAPVAAQPRTVRAGEMLVLDNVLPTLFNATNTGGSVVITTPAPSSLVATGRTYTAVDGGGSYGQFIPGVTAAEGTGVGERPLQLMQLEESAGFRSNIGLAELTGNSATVRLKLHLPDTKTTAVTEVVLAPNEFRQFAAVAGLNPGKQTYNARLEVEVIGGNGRVTAYGSV